MNAHEPEVNDRISDDLHARDFHKDFLKNYIRINALPFPISIAFRGKMKISGQGTVAISQELRGMFLFVVAKSHLTASFHKRYAQQVAHLASSLIDSVVEAPAGPPPTMST